MINPDNNPELFKDPSNPPPGWAYDEWHAFWYCIPTAQQIRQEWVDCIVLVLICSAIALYDYLSH